MNKRIFYLSVLVCLMGNAVHSGHETDREFQASQPLVHIAATSGADVESGQRRDSHANTFLREGALPLSAKQVCCRVTAVMAVSGLLLGASLSTWALVRPGGEPLHASTPVTPMPTGTDRLSTSRAVTSRGAESTAMASSAVPTAGLAHLPQPNVWFHDPVVTPEWTSTQAVPRVSQQVTKLQRALYYNATSNAPLQVHVNDVPQLSLRAFADLGGSRYGVGPAAGQWSMRLENPVGCGQKTLVTTACKLFECVGLQGEHVYRVEVTNHTGKTIFQETVLGKKCRTKKKANRMRKRRLAWQRDQRAVAGN